MNKTIRTLLLLSLIGASKLALAGNTAEMTVSQSVAYVGFPGKLQYHNESPTAEQIAENCSDSSNLLSSSFPKTMPPRKPREKSSDQYSMTFKYNTSSSYSCGVPLTTVIGWNYKGVSHQCYVTVVLGGGGQSEFDTDQYKKSHLCTISGDCYSDDCSPDNDSGGKLWRIKPKM